MRVIDYIILAIIVFYFATSVILLAGTDEDGNAGINNLIGLAMITAPVIIWKVYITARKND